ERFGIDHGAVVERFQVADVHHVILLVPAGVAEAALGDAAEQRHLAALERPVRLLGAGAGVLALAAARRRLAVTPADAAAAALLLPAVGNALMYGRKVHLVVSNPKSECRNPKQARMSTKKTNDAGRFHHSGSRFSFEFEPFLFEFVSGFDIRISYF